MICVSRFSFYRWHLTTFCTQTQSVAKQNHWEYSCNLSERKYRCSSIPSSLTVLLLLLDVGIRRLSIRHCAKDQWVKSAWRRTDHGWLWLWWSDWEFYFTPVAFDRMSQTLHYSLQITGRRICPGKSRGPDLPVASQSAFKRQLCICHTTYNWVLNIKHTRHTYIIWIFE